MISLIENSTRTGWYKFRIAEALGVGETLVWVVYPGPPVLVVVNGSDYDDQDRPGADIEAYHPYFDGISWQDIWEAVQRQSPDPLKRRATAQEYQAIKESIAKYGAIQRVIVDETGNVIAGRNRKKACTELGINCPTEVISGLTPEQKEELSFQLDYCRKNLTLSEKRSAATTILKSNPRNTDRVVGRACGLDHKTVGAIRMDLEEHGEIPQVQQRQGADGKTYRFAKIVAETAREIETAQRLVTELPPNSKAKALDVTTAKRRVKRNQVRQEIENKAIPQLPDYSIRIFNCPFQELEKLAGIEPATSPLILTDIPYQKEWLAQLPDLAQFAMRVLSDGGLFVTYSGTAYLSNVVRILEDAGLRYRWMLKSEWSGQANVFHPYNVVNNWLPVLVFSKGEWRKRGQWPDALPLCPKEKDWHEWQRPMGEIESLVRYFSHPGDLVIETCGGGFTTAAACYRLNRRCISGDIDSHAVQLGLERLTQEREQKGNNN